MELEEGFKFIKWDIIGLSEFCRTGEGQIRLTSGNFLSYVGEENSIRGIGILVHKRHGNKRGNYMFLTGEFNAKMRSRLDESEVAVRPHGLGDRNDRQLQMTTEFREESDWEIHYHPNYS
ncbi:hypothetical protein HHI36_019136 [Cryptolaemus montrouzieri]|uniref:Uncharacterized protein n=1 Tax=Cryptolaemus montrouzieri TaxID=559131 RepID=A0ABD2P237_9CUCU